MRTKRAEKGRVFHEDGTGFREIGEALGMSGPGASRLFHAVMVKFAQAYFPELHSREIDRISRSATFQQAVRVLVEKLEDAKR